MIDAVHDRLSPLALRGNDSDDDRRASLRAAARPQVAKALQLAHELTGVLAQLSSHGIDAVPLRGPALAVQLYGDVAARPCDDLDLLVRRADLRRAAAALADVGFVEYTHRPRFAETYSYTTVHIRDGARPLSVETHWTLAYPPLHRRLDMEDVWRRCVLSSGPFGMRQLAPDDLLLHLCLHLAHRAHDAPKLWWHDLDRYVRATSNLDWDRFAGTVAASGAASLVTGTLSALRTSYGTPVPETILAAPELPAPSACWYSGNEAREELAELAALSRIRDRLRYAVGLLLPTPGFMRLRYGTVSRRELAWAYLRRSSEIVASVLRATASTLRHRIARSGP